MYLSTAEVNLYLAELKLLSQGQDIGFSGNAESYLKKGVEYSMRAYDKLAGLNHIPYYDNTFGQDKFDVTIKDVYKRQDQLHDITIAAYKAQGYTYQGTNAKNPQVLHDERVWMDKENPDFGNGPKN